MKELSCSKCGKHMAILRDASIRKDMVVYCSSCNESMIKQTVNSYRELEILKDLFKTKAK